MIDRRTCGGYRWASSLQWRGLDRNGSLIRFWIARRQRHRITCNQSIQAGTAPELRQISVVVAYRTRVFQLCLSEVTLIVHHFPLHGNARLYPKLRETQGFPRRENLASCCVDALDSSPKTDKALLNFQANLVTGLSEIRATFFRGMLRTAVFGPSTAAIERLVS